MLSSAKHRSLCATLILLATLGVPRLAAAGGSEVRGSEIEANHVRELVSEDAGVRAKAVGSYCNDGLMAGDVEYFPCILNEFQASGDAKRFLGKIPSDPRALKTLWAVDETVMKGANSPDTPKPMGASTFLAAFLNALGNTAELHPAECTDRALTLQAGADGWMAEMVEQKNLDLFASNPALLVDNWAVVEKHRSSIGFGSTDFEGRRKAIEKTFDTYCEGRNRPAGDCRRSVQFLAQS